MGKLSFKLIGALLFIAIAAMFLSSLFAIPYAVPFVGLLAASFIAAPQGSLMETLTGPLMETLNEMKTALETKAKDAASEVVTEQLKAVNEAIKELKEAKPGVTAEELKELKDDLDAQVKAIAILNAKVKGQKMAVASTETKSFNEILGEVITENAEAIRRFKKGAQEQSFSLVKDPEQKSKDSEGYYVKAVGDMSIAANFPTSTPFTQDVRNTLIQTPYNRVWLADLLPGGESTGSSVVYPKENGFDGGADLWTDKTVDKPQMDWNLTAQTSFFKWIAGYVIVDRDMLDDIAFLKSYLQQKMLISLKIAQNKFILQGSADTNPVTGLLAAATAYNGAYTNNVDKIIDASWGQLVEDTFEFYNPTTTITTPRDAVKIGLNKAAGSGEYDLPLGSVAFVNGKLTVGGIDVAPTTQIGTGNFLTFDKNATMFVRRMQPELRMFEDATLAKRNKIMFRVEERDTLLIFNNKAIVKGTLTP